MAKELYVDFSKFELGIQIQIFLPYLGSELKQNSNNKSILPNKHMFKFGKIETQSYKDERNENCSPLNIDI